MAKKLITTEPTCPKCKSTDCAFNTTRRSTYEIKGLDASGLILSLEAVEEGVGAGDTFTCLSCDHEWPYPKDVEYRKEE